MPKFDFAGVEGRMDNFPEYHGPEGPNPEGFNNAQLQALANLLISMGIYGIRMNLKVQDSPIHVKYANFDKDEIGSRLFWRKRM